MDTFSMLKCEGCGKETAVGYSCSIAYKDELPKIDIRSGSYGHYNWLCKNCYDKISNYLDHEEEKNKK
jgi:hypothetical protein